MEMKRIVVFLPPTAVRACDNLATRYGSSRSEVVRLAVGEGMAGARDALVRLQRVRLAEVEAVDARRAAVGRKRVGRPPASRGDLVGVVPLDAESAVLQMDEYGRSVRRLQPSVTASQLRVMLITQAELVGVSVDDVDDVVDAVVGKIFGDAEFLAVPDPTAPPE